MKQIKVAGFTSKLTADDKPTVSVFGEEGSGKTRFCATVPDPIGLLPLDLKSLRTFKPAAEAMGKTVIVPDKKFIDVARSIKIGLLNGDEPKALEETKQFYTDAYKRVLEDAMKLAESPDIASIVVDSNTTFWDWILFSHMGRRNKIDTFARGALNQDMIDFISALKHKNLLLTHRSSEVWKDTGEVDKVTGKKKQAPSGKNKAEGCSKLGYLINCEIEMVSADKSDDLDKKFRVKVRECQSKPLIEGEFLDDYGLSGESITWDNLMQVIDWEDAA